MNEKMTVSEKVRQIKRSFRLYMNGDASRSMREKGVQYALNWGVPVTELRTMAAEYGKDKELSLALWKDNVRECRILATYIMPSGQMTRDEAEDWARTLTSQELAELCAMNVFQYVDGVSDLAYAWISGSDETVAICGFHLLCRLVVKGHQPSPDQWKLLLEVVPKALTNTHFGLRRAAANCLQRLLSLGDSYEREMRQHLEMLKLDIF